MDVGRPWRGSVKGFYGPVVVTVHRAGLPDETFELAQPPQFIRTDGLDIQLCPCEGPLDDPGPHVEACPWNDPDYEPLGGIW